MAITQHDLVLLYIANFNRAPDKAGYDYWMQDGAAGATTFDTPEQVKMIAYTYHCG